ncbi:DUF5071 domain-containing protein [Hymenobacter jeollabukensis]|nr:DUF5071 domain-containing protein [Hymenobacter jeollabukensis]
MDTINKSAAALNPRRIVPVDETDYQAVHNLRRASEDQVLVVLDELLAWTRTGNSAITRGVGEVLAQHFQAIRPAVLKVLRGHDANWQYFLLSLVVGPVLRAHVDQELVRELRRLAQQPAPGEQAAERARLLLDEIGL